MIVTLDNFMTGQLKLPNLIPTPNGTDRGIEVQDFIDRYEREILIDGLGVKLYEEVEAAYETLEDAEQHIQDLVKGKTYDNNGITVTWEGFNHKLSFPAYFIYYKYLTENQEILTTFGTERPKGKNSEAVSAIPKAVNAYRNFHQKYQGQYQGPVKMHNAFGSQGLDWYAGRNSQRSLIQYLSDKSELYPDARFTVKDNLNSFGI